MFLIIFCILSSFLISYYLTPEIIKVAHANEIHDQPNERKVHIHKVPRFGGFAIFFGAIISMLVWSFVENQLMNIQHLVAALTAVFMIGLRDDFMAVRPSIKALVEAFATLLIIYLGDIRFTSLHGFLGVHEISLFWSYVITLLTVIVVTNAFNLIDGIDGLAGTVSLIVFIFYGIWFFLNHNYTNAIICFSIIGGLIGFLVYNYRTEIFMGDCGALFLGFTAAILTISFVNQNAVMKETHFLHFMSPISLVSCILVYPLFDTLRVALLRIARGRSPFFPDRNHIHHLLIEAKLTHLQSTIVVSIANIFFITLAIFTDGNDDNFLVPIIVFTAFLLSLILKLIVNRVSTKNIEVEATTDDFSELKIEKPVEGQ